MKLRFNARRFLTMAVLFAVLVPFLSASEVSAVWERIYRQAVTDDQRYAIMLKITELKDKDFAPLIAESLQNLYSSKIESGDASVRRTKLSLAKLLIQELGNLRSLDNAQLVFDVYHNSKDPFLRGEAALTLGKMRANEFVEVMARDLGDINLAPNSEDARGQEVNAFGLVQGLELMHSPIGFEPVFFASVGWYSGGSQVKETARAALKTMVDDPSPQLKNIILTEIAYDRKLRVVEAAIDSKAPAAAKIEIGRIGLDQGLTLHETDPQKARMLSNLRMASVKLLVSAQDNGSESAPLYQRMIDEAYNQDELLAAYTGLGHNGSVAAVNVLVKQLSEYNERQKTGLQLAKDQPIIRQIVHSIAETKSPAAKPALIEAEFSNHDTLVIHEVKSALDQIP